MDETLPSFDVREEPGRRLLHVVLRGFWDGGVMDEYMEKVRAAIGKLRRTGGCRYVLIDMVDFPIQSKAIAEGHAENLRALKRVGDARVALVMQSALSRLQAARVASDTGQRCFGTEAEARAWLFSPEA